MWSLPFYVCTGSHSYGMSHYLRLTRLNLRGLAALIALFAMGGAAPGVVGAIQLPDSALVALRDGRSWHATRLIRRWMAGAEGVSPGDTLTLARAEAGWGDWAAVRSLLQGVPWLDEVGGGEGWYLLGRAGEAVAEWQEASQAFLEYAETPHAASSDRRDATLIRRARVLAATGDFERAEGALADIRSRWPQHHAWLSLEVAQAASEAGLDGIVTRLLAGLEGPSVREAGWDLLPRAFLAGGDTAGAEAAYWSAIPERPSSGARAESWSAVGTFRMARGDSAGAQGAFRQVLEEDPRGAFAPSAALALHRLGGEPLEMALTLRGALSRGGRNREALEELSRHLESLPDSAPPSENLVLTRARLLAALRRGAEAVDDLMGLAGSESTAVAVSAHTLLAQIRRRQGRSGAARTWEDRLIQRFPSRAEAVDLVFFRGDDAHDRGALGSAIDYYREAVTMAPALNRAGLARMRWGQAHLSRGEYQEAATVYEAYLEAFPNGRRWAEAAYWAARSHSATGETERADELLAMIMNGSPLSYYAHLAAEQRGESYVPRLSSAVTAAGASADTASWIREGLRALDLAREAGLVRGASAMSRALRFRSDATDEDLLIVGEELNRRGLTVDGINVGWELTRRGRAWDERLLRIVYPFPYRTQLEAVAAERGLDLFLLAGLIRQESAFWTEARSRANALGLMQVVPATGRAVARALGPPGLSEAMLFIPEVNIHLGTAFLSDLMDRFTEGLPIVLCGYNAGPTRATRWRRKPEVADLELFTERIPFEETRGYVKSVVHYRALYAWLYREAS